MIENGIYKRDLLIIGLFILLALSMLSLRPIRGIMGDYYYEKGNFDQAAIWYAKVVVKEEYGGQGRNCSWYQGDRLKLKYSVRKAMENVLLDVAQMLGMGQRKDVKSLLRDPKIYLDTDNFNGLEKKEKLRVAKTQLLRLDNLNNYFELSWGKNLGDESECFAAIGSLLKGIIEEAEGKFISAESNYKKAASLSDLRPIIDRKRKEILPHMMDEYLNQIPLDWLGAKEFYENQLRNGETSVKLLVNLAYINAKFNRFSDSLFYFKEAYRFLKNDDLDRILEYFQARGTFEYPDDIELIPPGLMKKYPLLNEITFYEMRTLLDFYRIRVIGKSDGYIGSTGVKTPAEIIVRSAGYLVGNHGEIIIDGKNVSIGKRGYNIAVLNTSTGNVEWSENFDTSASVEQVYRMIKFINMIDKGKITIVAAADDASLKLTPEGGRIFEKIGAEMNIFGKMRWSYGIIGVKGSRNGSAIELMSQKPIEVYVINKNE